MTKENVINIVRHVFHYYDEQHDDYNWLEFNEACATVIDSLESNKIEEELEKIKEAIIEKYWDCDICKYNGHFNIRGNINDILQIINRHISELKGEQNNDTDRI